MESYRSHLIFIRDTRSVRICEHVTCFPDKLCMPIASSDNLLRASLADLTKTLKNASPDYLVGHLEPSTYDQLVTLAEILTNSQKTARPVPNPWWAGACATIV